MFGRHVSFPTEVRVPQGVKRYRLRYHPDDWARIWLRYADRTEEWFASNEGDHVAPWLMVGQNGVQQEAKGE
jgi:hypothetical protein